MLNLPPKLCPLNERSHQTTQGATTCYHNFPPFTYTMVTLNYAMGLESHILRGPTALLRDSHPSCVLHSALNSNPPPDIHSGLRQESHHSSTILLFAIQDQLWTLWDGVTRLTTAISAAFCFASNQPQSGPSPLLGLRPFCCLCASLHEDYPSPTHYPIDEIPSP